MSDVPLHSVRGWSPDGVARLRDVGIISAEQVVAVAATDSGLQSLSEQLHVSSAETRRLVDLARQSLSAETRAEMDKPADTSNYGLGVVKPRKTEPDR